MRLIRLGATMAVSTLLVTLAARPAVAAQSLDIVLTNDDGYEAPGLLITRDALVSAGHRVTIVAPLDDRSGSGSSHTTRGTLDYYPQGGGVWAVDGTPVDAVTLALVHVFRDDPPDLIISGANFGQNVGADVLSSGTVGAALAASRAGIPAIALSVGLDLREGESARPFASTVDAFAPAAAFLIEIVSQLAQTGGEGLLPPRVVLNVNYPAVGTDEVEGVRFATVSSIRGFRQLFSVAGEQGPARVELAPGNVERAEEGSDVALHAAGFATISVLDGNLDAGRDAWEPLLLRLVIER